MPAVFDVTETMLDECLSVIRGAFAGVAADFGLTEQNCPANPAFMTAERLRADFDSGRRLFVLTADTGRIVGFAQIAPEKHGADSAELERLCVLPAFRRRGFGTALLRRGETIARTMGARRLTVGIIDENDALKRWYASLGFAHTGTARFPNLPFTVGFMEKPLLS